MEEFKMIALKHITDERTGVTYYVDKMVLVSDGDGYADHEDVNGMNMYEIDLQPYLFGKLYREQHLL